MKIFAPIAFTLFLLATRPCMAQLNTGFVNPGTAADVSLAGASLTWSNPNGALAAGGTTASTGTLLSITSGTSDYLELTNFGFNIPTGSTINGIEVDVTHQVTGLTLIELLGISGSVDDNIVQLTGPGVSSVNKASGAAWPFASAGTAAYGSSSDDWGPTAWTAAMVNSPSFGVDISANAHGGVLGIIKLLPTASIDAVQIKITYSLPATLALTLSQWSVTRQGSSNLLTWQASAVDAAAPGAFTVERSANGADWTDLAEIPAGDGAANTPASGNGPATTPGAAGPTTTPGAAEYSYTDENPPANGTVYYRLKLHSAGQPDSWSTVQVLGGKTLRPLVSLYPNPFHDMINVSAPAGAFTRLILRNAQGATLWVREYPGGVSSTQIPVAGLPQGLYFLTVDDATWSLLKGS